MSANLMKPRIALHHALQRERRNCMSLRPHPVDSFIQPLMKGIVKVLRLQSRCASIEMIVVDEYRPEQRLFDVNIVRKFACYFLIHYPTSRSPTPNQSVQGQKNDTSIGLGFSQESL